MDERESVGRLSRFGRFLIEWNLFETGENNEETICIQRWSTRFYVCLLSFFISTLLVFNLLRVETQLIEVQNPSLELYFKLQNTYADINCPCSQISSLYSSFVKLTPVYYDICSSDFISQRWIDMLVDNMTFLRYVPDFRSTASNQFQVLRELCKLSQATLNTNVQSFFDTELISSSLLEKNLWFVDTTAVIDTFKNTLFWNVNYLISFILSFEKINLLLPGIETSNTIKIVLTNSGWKFTTLINYYVLSENSPQCVCDQDDSCIMESDFYDFDVYNNDGRFVYSSLQSNVSLQLQNWFFGCWILNGVLQSSPENSFLTNQTVLNFIATYFNWSSDSILSTALNLTNSKKTNGSNNTLYDLVQTSFVDDFLVELDYSLYFAQCRPQACFYSAKKYQKFLYICTSLLHSMEVYRSLCDLLYHT